MDGILWLIGSWLLVGLICYLFIIKVSEPKPSDASNGAGPVYSNRVSASSYKQGGSTTEEWLNPIIEWFFKITHHTPAPLMAWICSLNDASRRLNNNECEILFEEFGDHRDLKAMPKLSNIHVEKGPGEHLTLRTKINVPVVVVKLVASQQVKNRRAVTNYEAHVCDLYGEIEARIACIAGEIYFMSCFNGRPEMEIVLQDREPHKHVELNEQVVSEAIRRCIVSAVTNINLSQHEREIDAYKLRPGARNASPIQEMVKRLSNSYTPSFQQQRNSNKLYVKVIRAETLGANQAVDSPYVVIEMDEPVQKHVTSKQSTSYPFWEEEFIFDLNSASDEILFEVYDGVQEYPDSEEKFLGLSIVSFKEIPPSGDSIQALPLLTRPYRNDKVSGNLIVQFKFYHDSNVPNIGSETHEIAITNGDGIKVRENLTRKRQQVDKIYDIHDDDIRFTPTKTTSLFVKTISQDTNPRSVPSPYDRIPITALDLEPETDDVWRVQKQAENYRVAVTKKYETMPEQPIPYITPPHIPPYQPSKTVVPPYHSHSHESTPPYNIVEERVQSSPIIRRAGSAHERTREPDQDLRHPVRNDAREPRAETKEDERARKTNKKRDHSFFEELRRRLSGGRGKRRAKSVDLVQNKHMEEAYASLPASRDSSTTRPSTDGRELSASRSIGGEVTGRRSTLIYEVYKNGENKYYQVPPAVANDPEALKKLGRGKKLHVHNGHTFVAVKTKGGVSCNTCNSRIASSFHKQAYQCRDCRYICHKSCHADTLAPCQYSGTEKLKIEKDIDWVHFLAHQKLEEYISVDGV